MSLYLCRVFITFEMSSSPSQCSYYVLPYEHLIILSIKSRLKHSQYIKATQSISRLTTACLTHFRIHAHEILLNEGIYSIYITQYTIHYIQYTCKRKNIIKILNYCNLKIEDIVRLIHRHLYQHRRQIDLSA